MLQPRIHSRSSSASPASAPAGRFPVNRHRPHLLGIGSMLSSHTVYIIALLLLLSACSPAMQAKTGDVQLRAKPAARTIVINGAHNGRSVKLAVGDTLVVVLPSNAGTGYAWQVVRKSKGVLASVGSTTKARAVKSVRLGSRRQKRFVFRAIEPGNSRLRLVYRRPFEQVQPAATFEVYIRVKK